MVFAPRSSVLNVWLCVFDVAGGNFGSGVCGDVCCSADDGAATVRVTAGVARYAPGGPFCGVAGGRFVGRIGYDMAEIQRGKGSEGKLPAKEADFQQLQCEENKRQNTLGK